MTKIDLSQTIVLVWGPFTWKSILTAEISNKLWYFNIVSTDIIRNILRLQKPKTSIHTSTSNLDLNWFNEQRSIISDIIMWLLPNYYLRWEKTIIEWAHLNFDLIQFCLANWWTCIYLKNNLSWEKRVRLKSEITPITKVIKNNVESLTTYTEDLEISDMKYIKNKSIYHDIENCLYKDCLKMWVPIIEYTRLSKVFELIKSKYINNI